MTDSFTLRVRRTIRARADTVFEAWTDPDKLLRWWGPSHVRCVGASVDLRIGGSYYIENELADGRVLRIEGEFERIDPGRELVYTWRRASQAASERVTVRFEGRGSETEVTIVHERIATGAARDEHEHGWRECLDGLVEYVRPS